MIYFFFVLTSIVLASFYPIQLEQVQDNEGEEGGSPYAASPQNDFAYAPGAGWEYTAKRKVELHQAFKAAYENVRCLDPKLFAQKVQNAVQCKFACSTNGNCAFYAYWRISKYCETYAACSKTARDGNNIITVFKRLHECDIIYDEYLLVIAAAFPRQIVQSTGPGKNLHCICITPMWMFCAVFVVEGSKEKDLVTLRLDRTQPRERLLPFQIMSSSYGSHHAPVAFVSPVQMVTEFGRETSVAAEIEIMTSKRCMSLSQCLEGTPPNPASGSNEGCCPIKKWLFKSGDPVYILNSQIQDVEEGKPVPCISSPGLRSYAMRSPASGFSDPFDRVEGGLYAKVDYSLFVVFNEQDRATGICQDLPKEEAKKEGGKKKSRGGSKKKKKSGMEAGPSSDEHLHLSPEADIAPSDAGPSNVSPEKSYTSESADLGPPSEQEQEPKAEDSGSEKSSPESSPISRIIPQINYDPSPPQPVPSRPFEEDDETGPEWTTVKARQQKKTLTPGLQSGPGPSQDVQSLQVEDWDVSGSQSASQMDPQPDLSEGSDKPGKKSPPKKVYRARQPPNLRAPKKGQALDKPEMSSSEKGTMTESEDLSPGEARSIQTDQAILTDPAPSQSDAQTMTISRPSVQDQSTMTRPLRLKDFMDMTRIRTVLEETENQQIFHGEESEEDKISTANFSFFTYNHHFFIFLTLLFTSSFYIFLHLWGKRNFKERNIYVEF